AQGQAVGRALVDAGGTRDGDRGRHVVDGHAERVGGIGEGAVLVDQVDRDGRAAGAVGVGVGLGAVGHVGAGGAVAPVDDVAADGVGAGVGDRAQGQAVGRALVDAG